jgi:Fic family protein
VADEVQSLCEYINDNWQSTVHLAAYVLWKMNWIHPFADGNGRTARAVSYVVLSIRP